jgi:hypothetical protein
MTGRPAWSSVRFFVRTAIGKLVNTEALASPVSASCQTLTFCTSPSVQCVDLSCPRISSEATDHESILSSRLEKPKPASRNASFRRDIQIPISRRPGICIGFGSPVICQRRRSSSLRCRNNPTPGFLWLYPLYRWVSAPLCHLNSTSDPSQYSRKLDANRYINYSDQSLSLPPISFT